MDKPRLRPVWGTFVASRYLMPDSEITDGGIIKLPTETLPLVKVYAVGVGQLTSAGKTAPMQVKVGDFCIIPGGSSLGEFDWEGLRLFTFSESSVLSIVDNAEELIKDRHEMTIDEAGILDKENAEKRQQRALQGTVGMVPPGVLRHLNRNKTRH